MVAPSHDKICTFILRVRQEPRVTESEKLVWRGSIEHVQTGKRYYVKELDELFLIVIDYLRDQYVTLPWFWRLWTWWHKRR